MTMHERFILGQGESGRLYLVHTRLPRFIAELMEEDEADIDGLTMSISTGEVVCRFDWIDSPDGHDLHALRRDLEAAVEESDFRAEREIDGATEQDELAALAEILGASRINRREAKAVLHRLGLASDSEALTAMLAFIHAHPRRAEIESLAR